MAVFAQDQVCVWLGEITDMPSVYRMEEHCPALPEQLPLSLRQTG
jgi:hypothetical protein